MLEDCQRLSGYGALLGLAAIAPIAGATIIGVIGKKIDRLILTTR